MNWDIIQSFCISISVIGAAITYIYKAIVAARKPSDTIKGQFQNIDKKLDRDNQRLNKLEEELNYISKAVSMLMRSNLVILSHLSSGNNTGELKKMGDEIQEFLINN